MSETLGPGPEEVGFSESESRFGDKEAITTALEHGHAQIAGKLEEFYDIAPHRNVVELAYVRHETIGTRGVSDFVVIDDENGNRIEAIFKPVSGEDKKFHDENGLGHDYPREVAAYLVDQHFGFDLVPPTVYRQIDNKLGSLQLFMPNDSYRTSWEAKSKMTGEQIDQFVESDDVKRLAVFDWIIANADRNVENFMFHTDANGNPKFDNGEPGLIAIDNGAAFNELFYRLKANREDLPGPYQFLTYDHQNKSPLAKQIPSELMEKIRVGSEKRDVLSEKLLSLPDISREEIDSMWQRIDDLIETGMFLSGLNHASVIENQKKRP